MDSILKDITTYIEKSLMPTASKDKVLKKVFVIVGPTSSGKTTLALDLCKKFDGEIISADSRQIYKYMNMGTGKIPTKFFDEKDNLFCSKDNSTQLNGVSVWGYDLVNPGDYFSGYDFAKFALAKCTELQANKKNIFIVGGTGFYIDLITNRKAPSYISPNNELRIELAKLTTPALCEKLTRLNSLAAEKIDKNNRHRLIRAIEIQLNEKKETPLKQLPYLENTQFIFIGLTKAREVLYKHVDEWLEFIWKHGLLTEVKNLIDLGYGKSPQIQGLVYKSALEFVQTNKDENEHIQRAKYDLHAYIRRQLTWFKANGEIIWFVQV